MPFWGVWVLLRVVAGGDTEEAFGPIDLIGHHVNWAVRGFADAVSMSEAACSAAKSIVQAEYYVRHTPFMRHQRTIVAPRSTRAGVEAAMGWLCEADALQRAAGERALQRRIRYDLRSIGAKVPKASTATASTAPCATRHHCSRGGDPATRQRRTQQCRHLRSPLHLHQDRGVPRSSMLQKTGRATREQLPSASSAED